MNHPIETLTFEQALQELEILVRRLEEGKLPLEEAITAYERGMALKAHCQNRLKAAKLRVDQIVLEGTEGPSLKPFDTPETSA